MIDSKGLVNKYFKYNKRVRNKFYEQIDEFNKVIDCNKLNKYKKGDYVKLNSNNLIHGTRISYKDLNMIKENGLIASEFINGKVNKKKKKPYVVEFWKVDEDIYLKDFIDKYAGVTIDVKGSDGKVNKSIISSFNDVEKNILSLYNYRDYIIYQNQEQRFIPNRYNNNSMLAFIIEMDDSLLFKNDIFDINFDNKILKKILPKWFYKKYFITRCFDNYETGREKALLYGIPSIYIKGIVVSLEYAKDTEILKYIKNIFPNCYICNIDGKVIM